ncbi:hypothetical protein [Streptomyces sp. NBC_01264]|nr:hypothetical protein [Streptomyces sp. NBC_01264]MCX4779409.1 hypothetical protein [Streptomyces sp. NBC_01264]
MTGEKLPSGGRNKPVWLWWSGTGGAAEEVDRRGSRNLHAKPGTPALH